MPATREIPECYEEGPDQKEHLSSTKHKQAVEASQVREVGRADIEQRLGIVVAEQGNSGSALILENLCLPNFQPVLAQETPSEAEKSMWQEYSKYNTDFSAGDQVSDEDAQKSFEQEMDMMGIWDATAEDDVLLAEVLAALDVSDPFDTTGAQPDALKAAEWIQPVPSRHNVWTICPLFCSQTISRAGWTYHVPDTDPSDEAEDIPTQPVPHFTRRIN
ncbi:hypothetical protein B0H14DRAFT_3472801 [Mycena olivaceomarginata]|nr:hypothetical protein B0H14DRAFT_3472801 [Mycena olivaceomarginata]